MQVNDNARISTCITIVLPGYSFEVNPLNLITALSNFTCIFPIGLCFRNRDYITLFVLLFLSTFSFISHLIENHKHGMGLPQHSEKLSFWTNRMDGLGCLILGIRMIPMLWKVLRLLSGPFILSSLGLFALLLISESEKTIKTRTRFIITHSIWHIGAFLMIWHVLYLFYLT